MRKQVHASTTPSASSVPATSTGEPAFRNAARLARITAAPAGPARTRAILREVRDALEIEEREYVDALVAAIGPDADGMAPTPETTRESRVSLHARASVWAGRPVRTIRHARRRGRNQG